MAEPTPVRFNPCEIENRPVFKVPRAGTGGKARALPRQYQVMRRMLSAIS
jgi:hypothetical protein